MVLRKLGLVLVAVVAVFAFASNGFAQPYDATMSVDGYDGTPDAIPTPDEAGGTPEVYEAINLLLGGSPLSSNADADSFFVAGDNTFWYDLGGGSGSNFAAIGITASNMNTLRVYDVTAPGTQIDVLGPETGFGFLGDGSMGSPFPGGVNPFTSGENFGFTLLSENGGSNVWDSDTANNSDGLDHMIAYYLPSLVGKSVWVDTNGADPDGLEEIFFTSDTYLLAWEDLDVEHINFDSDYNDTIFVVTRTAPVPEPATMALLGSGLLGLVGARRKKRS